jgi:hypothetical protein
MSGKTLSPFGSNVNPAEIIQKQVVTLNSASVPFRFSLVPIFCQTACVTSTSAPI